MDEKGEDEEEAEDDDKENLYEEAFAKMKRAAGVSEVEEVVHRSVTFIHKKHVDFRVVLTIKWS